MNSQNRILAILLTMALFLTTSINVTAQGVVPTAGEVGSQRSHDILEGNQAALQEDNSIEIVDSSQPEASNDMQENVAHEESDDFLVSISENSEMDNTPEVSEERVQNEPSSHPEETSVARQDALPNEDEDIKKGLFMPEYVYFDGDVHTEITIPLSLYHLDCHEFRSMQGAISWPEELDLTAFEPDTNAITNAMFNYHISNGTLYFAWTEGFLGGLAFDSDEDFGDSEATQTQLASIGSSGDALAGTAVNGEPNHTRFPMIIADTELPLTIATITFNANRNLPADTAIPIQVGRFETKSEDGESHPIRFDSAVTTLVVGIEIIEPYASELYIGNDANLISSSKKAISVSFPGKLSASSAILGESSLYYNPQRSIGNTTTYVGLVDSDAAIDPTQVEFSDSNEAELIFGDTNCDGTIDAQDALNILHAWLLNSDEPLDDEQILRMNVTPDSGIDTDDVLAVVDYFINNRNLEVVMKK